MVFVRYDCVERRYEAVDLGDGQRDVPSTHQAWLCSQHFPPNMIPIGIFGFRGIEVGSC
jgi:hypothetical protein